MQVFNSKNRIGMKKHYFIIFLLLFFTNWICIFNAQANIIQKNNNESFFNLLDLYAEISPLVYPWGYVDHAKIQEAIAKLNQTVFPDELIPERDLLIIQLLFKQRKYDQVQQIIEQNKSLYQEVMPEWYIYQYFSLINQNKEFDRDGMADQIGTLLPATIYWSQRRDSIRFSNNTDQKYIGGGITGSGAPMLSHIYGDECKFFMPPEDNIQIAQIFERNGQYAMAVNRYLLTVYMDKSPKQTDAWLAIITNEQKLNHPYLAAIAGLRAALNTPGKIQEIKDCFYHPLAIEPGYNNTISTKDAAAIADIYENTFYWPLANEALRMADVVDVARIQKNIDSFKNAMDQVMKDMPDVYRWGMQMKNATMEDYANFHIPMPSETFWSEETLYQAKNQ